jgi:hypothetical protein
MEVPHEKRPGNRYAREVGDHRTVCKLMRAKICSVAVPPAFIDVPRGACRLEKQ